MAELYEAVQKDKAEKGLEAFMKATYSADAGLEGDEEVNSLTRKVKPAVLLVDTIAKKITVIMKRAAAFPMNKNDSKQSSSGGEKADLLAVDRISWPWPLSRSRP